MMETMKAEVLEEALENPEDDQEVEELCPDEDESDFLKEALAKDQTATFMRRLLRGKEEDQGKRERADRFFDGIKEFVESSDWYASIMDKEQHVIGMGFTMQNTTLKVLIQIDVDTESLSINATLPIICLEEYRMLMGSKLSKLNEKLRFGAFRLDEDDGEINYRFTYSIEGQEFLPQVFEKYLDCCLITPDLNYKSIARTATGSMSNQEKIRVIGDIKKMADAINS